MTPARSFSVSPLLATVLQVIAAMAFVGALVARVLTAPRMPSRDNRKLAAKIADSKEQRRCMELANRR